MNEDIPFQLLPVLEVIDECPRTQRFGSWKLDGKGRWILKFIGRLSVEPSKFMPHESSWFLVVDGNPPRLNATIYPAVDGGITCTFPHQSANVGGPPGSLWRMGNPCVERPEAAFKRDEVAGEPLSLSDRLIWRVGRLLSWMDAAASDKLMKPGDPIELPSFNYTSTPVLGFTETPKDLTAWTKLIGEWGFATTVPLNGAINHRRMEIFANSEGRLLKAESSVQRRAKLKADAIWVLLPRAPIIAPWQAPMTWRELTETLTHFNLDLIGIFQLAGRKMRKLGKHVPTRLLLGFPFQEKVGSAPDRIHWIAAENIGLSSRDTSRNGFRPIEKNRVKWDSSVPQSPVSIRWIKTNNWSSDQIRTRGASEDAVQSSRTLIIGAGAIGSAVAENLARSGVCNIGIIDSDLVEVGNLSRHTLGLSECGHDKAKSVALRLENCGPDIIAKSFNTSFPPQDIRTIEALQSYDVVIDCTGSDAVIHAMASFNWENEKVFISISIGWEAKECFCFSASESMFPAIDALERFSKGITHRPNMETANREGIGCWHPVFPASSDDIQLWSAIGTKFVRKAIVNRDRACKVFTLSDNATVTVTDV